MHLGGNGQKTNYRHRMSPNLIRTERLPSIFEDDFSLRKDTSIFTSIAKALIQQSKEIS